MATTHNITSGQSLAPLLTWQKFAIEKLVDMSVIKPASGDTIQCINVSEGMLITDVRTLLVVAEGGAATIDVGDGDDPNGFDNDVDINATAGAMTIGVTGTDAYYTANGRYYTEDDTIDVLVNSANVDAAKVLLIVEGVYLQDSTLISTL